MIKTILFDFAGVVTKSAIFPRVAKVLGPKTGLGEEDFLKKLKIREKEYLLGEISTEDYWKSVCKGTTLSLNDFVKEISWYEINDEVVGLIKRLGKRYATVLLTDNYDILYKAILRDKKLKNLFRRSFFSNVIHRVKMFEGEKVFHYVLDQLKAKPEECAFIDDKSDNLSPAKQLGIQTIQFVSYGQLEKDLVSSGVKLN